jgi:hypothetical protein
MQAIRRMMLFLLAMVWCIATSALHAANAKPAPAITVTVTGKEVSASGLTPGGAAAVLTSWRTKTDGFRRSSQSWCDARADASGTIRVTFTQAFPTGALVAVVDVTTGTVQLTDVGAPRFRRSVLPAKHLKRDDKGEVGEVSSPEESIFIVVVRPGDGVWVQIASDGGTGDDDGRVNGRVRTDPASLKPIAYSPAPPKKIKSKDLVFVLDGALGTVSSVEVTQ